jgi:hypothetical protein
VEDRDQCSDYHQHDDYHVVPYVDPYQPALLTGLSKKRCAQSHSRLNQKLFVLNVFQSIAPVLSSLSSLGVGLGVRDSCRGSSPTLVSSDDVEFMGG